MITAQAPWMAGTLKKTATKSKAAARTSLDAEAETIIAAESTKSDAKPRAGPSAKAKSKPVAAKPRSLVQRVYNTIDSELTKLEKQKGLTSQDRERASRALSQMVNALVGATATDDSSKWWAHSKTMWGTLITAAATVIPVLGPALGITLPADVFTTFGDQAVAAVQALTGLFGTVLAIYGRLNAESALTLRKG